MTDDLRLLLENIRQEAHRIAGDGGDLGSAYSTAINSVIMQAAEGQVLDAFEEQIIAAIRQAERDFNGQPVPTMALAVRLGIPDRIRMWRYLSDLEQRGLIYRPFGKRSKSGWRVAA